MQIVNDKAGEPDTLEEFVEAAKVFDHDNDGKIEVAELHYAMSRLGDPLEDDQVDSLINDLDPSKSGFVDIIEWAIRGQRLLSKILDPSPIISLTGS